MVYACAVALVTLVCPAMAPEQGSGQTLLGAELARRLKTLGLSRREFVSRSGISRQTLHKIEHEGHVDLRAITYALLDEHLKWAPGTAVGLAEGTVIAVEQADVLARADRESAYRWRIVERLATLELEQLERIIAIMERELLGESMTSTAHHILTMDRKLAELESERGIGDPIGQEAERNGI